MDFSRPARVIAQDVDHHRHIDVARLENRLAIVEGFELGKLVNVLFDEVPQPPDEASALAGRHLAPRPTAIFKSATSGLRRAVDILARSFDNLGQHFTRSGIDGVELL